MRRLGIALAVAAGFLATTDFAAARDGCGRGYGWNGYRCVPLRPAPPPPGYIYGPGYGAPPPVYYRRSPYRTYNGCPPGWTVQSGQCKPYRGY